MPIRFPARPLPATLEPPPRPPSVYAGPLGVEPELVAECATTATQHAGPCALCSYAMLRGDRVACLVSSGRWAHVSCLGGRP